ncbi:50S ribosomal protein L15 [Aureispira sp. CCB-E]|uniref:50S ribosomal protein L15 n=1 Tax=Aureispira sp. CCB-E TaxID=3051121 RepID=UPI002869134E|nr:50S ribosomal protein L15 [Aureispira sp. CCB-E]WMX14807.1 50S ribosomal protein L15 [Aureispira sp. CCB-E]
MKLNNLKPAKGSVKNKKRIARGVGAGSGRTATRGHKGAKSRSGFSNMRYFEGGQMPLQKVVPKRGFKNTHRRYQSTRPTDFTPMNLSQLEYFASKHNLTEITSATLRELGVISGTASCKVLGAGELKTALEVTANRFSASAKKAILDAGGKAFVELKLNTLQGIADADGVDKIDLALIRKHFSFVGEDDAVHVVAEGTISNKLTLEVNKISEEAKAQVEALGGSIALV